ncbi:MAG: PIG-L family deacetylase, partial [Candidatus Atribacteria bacterium]|nr:PIG-L family deacetylase [Candidatus Atribacteria bacterium]
IFTPFFHVYSRVYTKVIEPLVDPSEKILIFAPHPDDEILACAGVIQQAVAAGKTVKVVFITSGDSFGAGYAGQKGEPNDIQKIELGYLRQSEAAEAAQILGLSKENIIFLGYPDRGMDKMWWVYRSCEKTFLSPYTKRDTSPYLSSFTISSPYCGDQVVQDMEEILDSFKPGTIYLPHPADLHSDHHATYCFVKEALEKMREKGSPWVQNVHEYLYLVHFGRMKWPPLWGYDPRSWLYPPSQLLATRNWTGIDLTDHEINKKKDAVERYRSQELIMDSLLAFVKRNENFAIDVDYSLPPQGKVVIPDSRNEFTVSRMVGGGDLRQMEVERNQENITLRLFFDSGIPLRARYRFYLVGYRDGQLIFRESYLILEEKRVVKIQGDYIDPHPVVSRGEGFIALTFRFDHRPLPAAIFVSADSSLQFNYILDRLPWSLVTVEPDRSDILP